MNATSNSKGMSFEEKLIAMIQNDSMMKLVDDDAAMLDLAKRAVEKAVFEPRRKMESGHWNSNNMIPSPAVVAAQHAAEKIADKIVGDIFSSEDMVKQIRSLTMKMLPDILQNKIITSLEGMARREAGEAIEQFRMNNP
jgi:hypothetical protein